MAYRALLLPPLLLLSTLGFAQSQVTVLDTSPVARRNPNLNATERTNMPAPPGQISGSVRTIDDRPVADARIELRATGSAVVLASAYSNEGGSFEVDNIPAGQYELVARSGMAETLERVDVQGMKSFVTLRLPGGAATSNTGSNRATVSVAQMKIPEKARKAFLKGREAFGKGKLDEARAEAETALKIAPDYADGLTLRALLSLNAGQYETGRADLERAVECDPNDGMAFVVLGSAYNALHRPDDALRVLERGASLVPDSWQVYFERARALVSKHAFGDALPELEKARQFAPRDFPTMHLVKANALLGLKQYPEAQAELQAYLDREPQGINAAEARRVLEQLKAATATASTK